MTAYISISIFSGRFRFDKIPVIRIGTAVERRNLLTKNVITHPDILGLRPFNDSKLRKFFIERGQEARHG